jgi:hypothetical protein
MPRVVMEEKFSDVFPMLLLWKEQAEYKYRVEHIRRQLNEKDKT